MTDNVRGYGGFKWVRSLYGYSPPSTVACRVASGYTGAINGGSSIDINIGDPVRFVSTGTVAHAAGNEAAGNNGQDIFGIVIGVMPYYDGYKRVPGFRLPYNTVYGSVLERQSIVLVYPVAGQLFEIDVDDATTATTEAGYTDLIGNNADHRLTTGSEPRSNCLLDISTAGTATAQWRIVDIAKNVGNQDFSGGFVKLWVTCNEPQMAAFSATGPSGV